MFTACLYQAAPRNEVKKLRVYCIIILIVIVIGCELSFKKGELFCCLMIIAKLFTHCIAVKSTLRKDTGFCRGQHHAYMKFS